MSGPLGRQGPAATFVQQCLQMVYNHPVSRGIMGLMYIEPIRPRATGDYNIITIELNCLASIKRTLNPTI